MQPADQELDGAALATALMLAEAANDAVVPALTSPPPPPTSVPALHSAAVADAFAARQSRVAEPQPGWDPAEVWRTRIRDARRERARDADE